jgi:hypothetical protein
LVDNDAEVPGDRPWPMNCSWSILHVMRRHPERAVLALTMWLACSACDTSTVAPSDVAVQDVNIAWQAEPFRVRDEVLAAAFEACRHGMNAMLPPAATVVLADIRGAGKIRFLLQAARRQYVCQTQAKPNGTFVMTRASGGTMTLDEMEPVQPGVIRLGTTGEGDDTEHGRQSTSLSSEAGQVGPGVARVEIILTGGTTVRATTENGWFSAWWPTNEGIAEIRALDAFGQRVDPPRQPLPTLPQ